MLWDKVYSHHHVSLQAAMCAEAINALGPRFQNSDPSDTLAPSVKIVSMGYRRRLRRIMAIIEHQQQTSWVTRQ